MMKEIKLLLLILLYGSACYGNVIIYPAPAGELLNNTYTVTAGGRKVPVYNAKVGAADDNRRFKAVDDVLHSADYYDTAAFSYFDMAGQTDVSVYVTGNISSAKILPSSAGIHFTIHRHFITFKASVPGNLTIEINGETVKSLHIFINPIEKDKPKANDPNVIFFGPGIHEISNLTVGDNKTIYIAGGAIVRATIGKNESYGTEPSGLKNYAPRILLRGNHIKLCGHGIIDASECPTHAGNFIVVNGNDITLDGIIVRNSCGWTIPLRRCNNVTLNNIKILGYRANSDGIDICNSSNVTVKKSFVRTNDDLIVIKTEQGEGPSNHIVVEQCVLWNPIAHALSLGAELRENVSDVLFTNCDIIHDRGREWSLRVFQSDSSLISNIRFEKIRVEESHRLISLWIDKNASSFNKQLGYIDGVIFKNINAIGNPLSIEMHGGDISHLIKNTMFDHVILNYKPLQSYNIEKNQFYHDLSIMP